MPSPYDNVIFPAAAFTASGQTSAPIVLGSQQANGQWTRGAWAVGMITLTGVGLTTATFGMLGSSDGGVTYNPVAMAAAGAPGTFAATMTATAAGLYRANLAGLTHVKFVTSGTFTAASISVTLTASPTGSAGQAVSGSATPSGPAGGDLSGTYPNPTVSGVNGAAVPASQAFVGTNSSSQIVPATAGALPSGTTATTQATSDNTTKVATTAYVKSVLPTALPPNGSAGGDLSGTYPNPTVSGVNGAAVPASQAIVGTNGSGQIVGSTAFGAWSQTTPTPAAQTGAYAAASSVVRVGLVGKTASVYIQGTVTSVGTGTNAMVIALPFTPMSGNFFPCVLSRAGVSSVASYAQILAGVPYIYIGATGAITSGDVWTVNAVMETE